MSHREALARSMVSFPRRNRAGHTASRRVGEEAHDDDLDHLAGKIAEKASFVSGRRGPAGPQTDAELILMIGAECAQRERRFPR